MTSENRTAGWGWFLAWTAVGACAATGVASLLSVGVVLLVVAAGGAVVLLRKGPHQASAGSLAGVSLLLFYLAYLNRGGPGNVCHAVSGGSVCTEEYSPVPFLAAGGVLLVAGFVLHHVTRRASV